MKVEIKIDSECAEPRVIVITDKLTEEVNEIISRIEAETPQVLAGFRGDFLEVLEQENIVRVYSSDKKIFAVTNNGEYKLRVRLYELEERLDKKIFVRISQSEIINLNWVKNFDLSFTGTICVMFKDGTTTYVSRRYVSKIKKVLGV